MANDHFIFPLDDDPNHQEAAKYFTETRQIYLPTHYESGRFPTRDELRHIITESNYDFEERQEWFVSSDEDHTEIWFSENDQQDKQQSFSFRRGSIIILDMMQKLANQCGSFLIVDGSGAVAVLIVPDSVFGISPSGQGGKSFIDVMTERLPLIFERLKTASFEDTLFLLSQVRQCLESLFDVHRYNFYQIAHEGLPIYKQLLTHEDARVRFLAFDLIRRLPLKYHQYASALTDAIRVEADAEIKTRMIWAIESLITKRSLPESTDSNTQAHLNILSDVCADPQQAPSVRFGAANLLARARKVGLTTSMRELFVDGLVHPEIYQGYWSDEYVIDVVLETIKSLFLKDRLEILQTALPNIRYARDAHNALRALLDYAFFGASVPFSLTSLTTNQEAERPDIDPSCFRNEYIRNCFYFVDPIETNIKELLPFQRQILSFVLELDVPWMVHSNLLAKYGLPPTRAAVRALLEGS